MMYTKRYSYLESPRATSAQNAAYQNELDTVLKNAVGAVGVIKFITHATSTHEVGVQHYYTIFIEQ